jgi:shikimate kinase
MSDRSIALVGLSGAGKSSLGRVLAEHLGWPLIDTDSLIIQNTGRSIPEIFRDEGEAAFREYETAALQQALDRPPSIIATGAGIVLRQENRVLLQARAFVVWLDAPTPALVARLRAHDEERPLLTDSPEARLEALRATRAPLYTEVAHLRVPTENRTVAEIAQLILSSQHVYLP